MLDFLRKNATGPLGIALIILLVFAFSIWGVGDIFRGYNANILATIGNREVNAENYLFRFNREINRVSNQLNRLVSSVEARNSGLHYQVLDRMIVETTINASGDEINLKASEEALKKRILATNAFKNAFNQFDKNIFDQVLRHNGLTEDSYLAIEGDFHVQEQLSKSIFTNINPPSPLNSLLYKYQFERRNVDYIIISPENDIDLTKISDESSLNFYNKNQNKYLTEETRDFSFISLIISDISSNFDIKNEEVISYYEDNKYDYFEPEKRGYDLVPFTSEKEALNALENYKLKTNYSNLLLIKNNHIKPEVYFITDQLKAQDYIYELYASIEDSRASGKTLEEIALENKLPIKILKSISSVGKKINGGYINTPLREIIIENVFGNETDIEIDPIEDEEGNIVFIRVDNINTPKQISYNEVAEDIKATIAENKSVSEMQLKALEIFNSLKSDNNNLEYTSDINDIAIAKSGLLSRSSTNEIFSENALIEIFKADKESEGYTFDSNKTPEPISE